MGQHAKKLPPMCERQLREAYGDFAKPDFGFVLKAMRNEAAAVVFRDLAKSYRVDDDTDVNYHVCFTYVVQLERQVIVKLSMVGPYALIAAIDVDGREGGRGVLIDEGRSASADEARVAEIVIAHGFSTLSADELSLPVPLSFSDRDEATLYAALFEPAGEMSWIR